MIKPHLNLNFNCWFMKETLNSVQLMWVILIWVNDNYFAYEVIFGIEL
jgi:hypothetical protein